MAKQITVLGTGYVGLVLAVCLSDFGNTVVAADIDVEKISALQKGRCPIYEPGINEYIERNRDAGRLHFSHDVASAIRTAEIIFIAVGTPPGTQGKADLRSIFHAADLVAESLHEYALVVVKSTVPVGTNRSLYEYISTKTSVPFDLVSNPEFLREGRAMQDFFHPDRVVVGSESERAREVVAELYRPFNLISVPFLWCGWETAELIKYASNTFLATKITFINQLANLSEELGADIHQIAKAMGMDGRISPKFLHPGPGFGGSCFPKDVEALIKIGEECHTELTLLKSVVAANVYQKRKTVQKVIAMLGGDCKNKTVAVLGLAFKQETDDVRESSSIVLVEELLHAGARIHAHDPKAAANFKKLYPSVEYFHSEIDACDGADIAVFMTEWNIYRNIDLKSIHTRMRRKKIYDARNLFDPQRLRAMGFHYESLGR